MQAKIKTQINFKLSEEQKDKINTIATVAQKNVAKIGQVVRETSKVVWEKGKKALQDPHVRKRCIIALAGVVTVTCIITGGG